MIQILVPKFLLRNEDKLSSSAIQGNSVNPRKHFDQMESKKLAGSDQSQFLEYGRYQSRNSFLVGAT